jgi:serine/threonine protein kinase
VKLDADAATKKMIGNSLTHYRVTAKLGEGGMGEVFRARDTRLNRDVAVKALPKDFVADAERLRTASFN